MLVTFKRVIVNLKRLPAKWICSLWEYRVSQHNARAARPRPQRERPRPRSRAGSGVVRIDRSVSWLNVVKSD